MTKLRFEKKRDNQIELHRLAREITGLKKEVPKHLQTIIIALGDAKFNPNSPIKGHRSTPHAGLVRILQRYAMIVNIDEYRTSKLCSRCSSELETSGDIRRDANRKKQPCKKDR